MCAVGNSPGAPALLLSLDATIVNNFQKSTQCFNKHSNVAPHLSNRVTISRYRERELKSKIGYPQLFLQPQILPHKKTESLIKKCLFGLSTYLTDITALVAVRNSK